MASRQRAQVIRFKARIEVGMVFDATHASQRKPLAQSNHNAGEDAVESVK